MALHRRLPAWTPPDAAADGASSSASGSAGSGAQHAAPPRIHRRVRYAPEGCDAPRCTVDVYVPPGLQPGGGGGGSGAPVVLFCHGGVWAAGEWRLPVPAAELPCLSARVCHRCHKPVDTCQFESQAVVGNSRLSIALYRCRAELPCSCLHVSAAGVMCLLLCQALIANQNADSALCTAAALQASRGTTVRWAPPSRASACSRS